MTTIGTSHRQISVRDDLKGLTPYTAAAVINGVVHRLNNNESPYPPPADVIASMLAQLKQALEHAHRYPDTTVADLRESLADYVGHDIRAAQVWAGNGSNEVLLQLLLAYGGPGRRVLGFTPDFSMHRQLAAITGSEWLDGSRSDDFTLTAEHARSVIAQVRPDIIMVSNPNNPTGIPLPDDTLEVLVDAARDSIVVIDEAYHEFASARSVVPHIHDHQNLVVARTLSKAFAMAGVRIGYIVAAEDRIRDVRMMALPYPISSLALTTAKVALAHAPRLLERIPDVLEERDGLRAELESRGLHTANSDANFLLFTGMTCAESVLADLTAAKIAVRDVGPPGWLRVSIGTPEDNRAFLAVLDRANPTSATFDDSKERNDAHR
ncbi:histidinol-phosphate transaminase [Mycobacterium sp. NPDC050441]|uniref:histidinol-phosphate transaminase n=1 Tax=Mycobacterium sp. NPDC050441 TaxID=3155403 RepID=UPI0033D26F55